MSIGSSYKLVRNSIVAFAAKYVPAYDQNPPPQFPPIIGTGFVVREDGIIATNAHVLHAFKSVPRPPNTSNEEWPVACFMLKLLDQGMIELPLQILGAVGLRQNIPQGTAYYGPPNGPDLAFVHVKARGLPTVSLAGGPMEEGTEVATAGFPMGTDALSAPGWIHQMTPTLQRGIISAVLPFVCPTPHAYAINIMVQGGASGSPVFLSGTGDVIGVLYAGLNDRAVAFRNNITADGQTSREAIVYTVPTNISYVVPSHYIRTALDQLSQQLPGFETPKDAQTIDEMLKHAQFNNAFEGRQWAGQWNLREVDANTEAQRVSSLSRINPPGESQS